MKITKVLLLLAITILLILGTANAVQRFTLKGEVINAQSCEPIANLKIHLTHVQNGIELEVNTDSEGKFRKTFVIMGNIRVVINDPSYQPFTTNAMARLGTNDIGFLALLKLDEPVTQVCDRIKNTPFGKMLKKSIVEIPEIDEEKGLSDNYQEVKTAIAIRDYASALPILLEEEKSHPDNYAIQFFLGLCYYNSEDFDNAITKWEKARQIDSAKYLIYGNLAKAWEKKGDNLKAAEFIQKFADATLTDDKKTVDEKAEAFFESGKFWYNANNLDKYFRSFSKVIEFQPTNGDAYYYIGMYHFSKQQNKEALVALQKVSANNVSEEFKQTVLALKDALKP